MNRYKPVGSSTSGGRDFRAKSKGWRGESHRHYLAAKGIKTKYQQKFPDLVKDFPGENPRITTNFARFRQEDPKKFVKGTFRTKTVAKDKEIILGEDKKTHNYEVQSVLIKRDAYFAQKRILKKGKVHSTRSGDEVRMQAQRVQEDIRPFVKKSAVVGSIRREVDNPVDVDIVAVPKNEQAKQQIKDKLRSEAGKVYVDGDKKFSASIDGVKTEVVFAKPEEYGAALLTYTGPFGANISKRAKARSKGLLLNEKGLFKKGKRIASTEKQIYNKLGYTYRKPSIRGEPRS